MRQEALKFVGAVVVLALVVGFAGAALAQEEAAPAAKAPPADTLYQKAHNLGLTKYCELVQAAGLVDFLNQEGRMTVFAPSNEALVALGEEKLAALIADPAAAKKFILTQVILDRQYMLMALPQGSPLVSAARTQIVATAEEYEADGKTKTRVIVQGIELPKAARNFANNGILYKIDKVLPEGKAVPMENDAGE